MLLAIERIEGFLVETPNFPAYNNDIKTQSATERQLAIIGDALNNFRRVEPSLPIASERQIIGFRNRLIHSYDAIDNSIVWVIVKNHLPILKTEIESLNSKQ